MTYSELIERIMLMDTIDEDMGKLSPEASEYLTSIDKPLEWLYEISQYTNEQTFF